MLVAKDSSTPAPPPAAPAFRPSNLPWLHNSCLCTALPTALAAMHELLGAFCHYSRRPKVRGSLHAPMATRAQGGPRAELAHSWQLQGHRRGAPPAHRHTEQHPAAQGQAPTRLRRCSKMRAALWVALQRTGAPSRACLAAWQGLPALTQRCAVHGSVASPTASARQCACTACLTASPAGLATSCLLAVAHGCIAVAELLPSPPTQAALVADPSAGRKRPAGGPIAGRAVAAGARAGHGLSLAGPPIPC